MKKLNNSSSSCTCPPADERSHDVRHPLDPLTAVEIQKAIEIVRADQRYGADFLFETIELLEPEKSLVRRYAQGDPISRSARVNL